MDDLLTEQIAYYRARAAEYDDWWFRRGAYSLGADLDTQWFADVAEAESWLRQLRPSGHVLELAAGTGLWTRHLAELIGERGSLTCVDAAPEVLALNRDRVADARDRGLMLGGSAGGLPPGRVHYQLADLFGWQPPRTYGVIFFGYWLSHVPNGHQNAFWRLVRDALAPAGRVIMIDSAPWPPDSTSADTSQQTRTLADGRQFRVVKRYWRPDQLIANLADHGFDAQVRTTGHQMILLGTATRIGQFTAKASREEPAGAGSPPPAR